MKTLISGWKHMYRGPPKNEWHILCRKLVLTMCAAHYKVCKIHFFAPKDYSDYIKFVICNERHCDYVLMSQHTRWSQSFLCTVLTDVLYLL